MKETLGATARFIDMYQVRWQSENGSAVAYQANQPVRARPLHEGVGDALRAAYEPSQLNLPEDMKGLLARIR
ncbi:MAG: hypothetical protein JOY99_04770 [Sphingomonadaceae bacterium]|nr:hypothetical protein [Sphingomonadaceae bacterium]